MNKMVLLTSSLKGAQKMADPIGVTENSMDPMEHLPLPLLRSDVIPPAPNRSGHGPVIDWLPHFGGCSSWVAYGASSLCVISHFPSPHETLTGPIFRQVFQLSGDPSASVAAVSCSSQGDVAAALGNSISVFSHDSLNSKGSFCWSQTALLVQSTKVEAIEWTGSGDGIVAGGIEVVLWKHRSRAWEIAWKFRTAQPQTLVSSTWFIEGPSASAVFPDELNSVGSSIYEASKTVSICHSDGKSEYKKTELHHPQPVLMIQWRPSIKRQPDRDAKHSPRHVLLTCCLDGTVRLWTEIDTGRVRKANRDISEQKTMRHSYCAVAVIEINQVLDGALGINVFVAWATETGGIIRTDEEANLFLSTERDEHDNAGRCEWLVGFGPGTSATFWAIHCLDDVSPLRFPRVTLWKRQKSHRLETRNLHKYDCSNVEDLTLLNKVVIQRICSSGPPATLSSVHSLRSNALVWSHLFNGTANGVEDGSINKSRTENSLACSTNGDLNLDGHTGKILQVVPHPSRSEVELAVSIDSNGLLLFWSISSITNYDFGLPVFVPSWKLCGKHDTQVSFPKYVSLTWASLILDEDRVLLMGHVGGVDCFIVKVAQGQEGNIGCHKLCTVPFTDNCSEDGPSSIFCSHLPSTCNETLRFNRFMLLGIWMNGFQALSWEITLHSCDINGGCCYCNVDSKNAGECNTQNFKNVIAGKRYCLGVNLCSPRFPDLHTCDRVTSFAVICPGSIFPPIQKYQVSTNFPWSNGPAYIIATGCSDGSLKLWRSNSSKSLTSHAEWELVGVFVAHHGPVRTICLTECGRKIATVGAASPSAKMDTLKIWDSIPLTGTGCFMLEEAISLHGDIVDLKWLTIGNGQLLLGVCMQKELRIYGQRHCGSLPMLHSGRSEKIPIWTCIAFAHVPLPIVHLLWGPRASAVVVHDNYFCLFSQWLFLLDKQHHNKLHPNYIKDNLFGNYAGMDKDIIPAIFTDSCICDFKELSVEDSRESYKPRPQIDQLCSSLFASRTLLKHGFDSKLPFWSMTELSEKLCGSLPIYHPEALLMNIYSGNWKRACRAVRHLVEYINCKDDSAATCSLTKSSQIVPQILLSKYFEGNLSKGSTDQGFLWSGVSSSMTSSSQFQEDFNQFAYSSYSDTSNAKLTAYSSKSEFSSFIEPVKKLSDLAAVNDMEKIQLLAIIDILGELSSPDSASVYRSIDEPGQRFWIAVRFQQLYSVRRFGRLAAIEELNIDSGMIGWAFHSDCQENLFGSLLPNEPSWQEMRALGTGFWFTNATQLRAKMEKLARSQFLKKRDPKDCALLYIALKRLQVLAGLFKLSKDEKDKPLVGFLSRNFQEEKNKAAALKNAYVLMGRHQLELAVAFFLLGGDTSSAITVCAKNLGDEQLALVICRLVEGQGGSLERQLITKYILPSAIEKHDYWLASLMEWQIGNYSQSFVSMLGFQMNSAVDMLTFSSNQVAFLDPSIGLYCLTLATKNSLRNAVGEQNAAILSRWATLMTATALNRCGLPLESLECRASSVSSLGGIDQGSLRDNRHSGNIHQVLKPSPNDSTNWMLGDVAFHLESHAKLDLAVQYFSKLVKEHPRWPDFNLAKVGYTACSNEFHQQKMLLNNFQHKFHTGLESFDQKFSVSPASLTQMVLIFLCNNGVMFIAHDLIGEYTSEDCLQDGSHAGSYHLNPLLCTLLLKVSEEVSSTCSQYITACGTTFYQPNTYHIENDASAEVRSRWLDALGYSIRGLMMSICELRAALGKSFGSLEEDLINKPVTILDLYEYYVHFAAAWVQKNSKLLIMMVQPLLITYTNGHSPYELDIGTMKKILSQILESATYTVANGDAGADLKVAKCLQEKPDEDLLHTFHSIPEDERWQIVGVCLWQHMSNLMDHKLKLVSDELEGNSFPSVVSHSSLSSWASCLTNVGSDRDSLPERIRLVSLKLAKTLSITLSYISSSNIKQFASLLRQKAENGLNTHALLWLEEFSQSKPGIPYQHQNQDILTLDMMTDLDELSVTELLQDMCADPKIIFEGFARAKLDLPRSFKHKPSEKWSEIYKGIIEENETEVTCNHEGMLGSSSASGEAGPPSKVPFMNGHTLRSSWQKDNTLRKEVTTFQNPKEVYKRNGELLEAICINSIDQRQAALASNRKGIVFFSWEDDLPSRDQSDYIWSVADWPQNGWAGSESTPVPIFASPGVGVGSKKGAYLGLGGTTSGGGFMARPGRDLMVGGTFGLPGYASIGASGLGWGIQEDFEEFSDPAPTIGNISTRALYSHPSRPFFLVGSSNTHIYLWEFGKNIATATYGVLPAVNVPPPYALASISAVQFDRCGQRFATAALDGTVSTWQLEVGGRSNICPTESSPCFSSYTSDVTYITSSGSIIAASGYSSNGANVVIWDTLAPPSTSRASIICHEGGARSLSVFDNDIGSGSVSPLILTGGKGGDIGLHDFRYIATGRTKRHKHSGNGEHSQNVSDMQTGAANKPGDQNPNGMLWYIPKAHSGSVTKISTVPNTSLFLTGSKDGDVKLWDAKKGELVYHWPKLHERHTFLQPSSRGYGGVVRAAVTDIQVVSNGFLTCGGDGHVKLIQLTD